MANEDASGIWGQRANGWVRDTRLLDMAFAPFTAAVLEAADLGSATRVLDVGCGTGTLLEGIVDSGTGRGDLRAVGVDISLSMVDAARRRVPSAGVIRADAQVADLARISGGRLYDRVVSRFGVMFFDDPVAAFANIRAATGSGGQLAFASWREDETDMFLHGLRSLMAQLDNPVSAPAVGTPGPLGLANAEHIGAVLGSAGWTDVEVEAVDGLCDFCLDGTDGVEARLEMVLNGSVGQAVRTQLEPRLGPTGWATALEEAREELRGRMIDGGVRFTGHTWLVTARNQ